MTIASALDALNTDVQNARTAITNKGGTVTSGGGSSQLATDIATIPTGGSSPVITSLSVTPTTSAQTITAPSGTDGYSPITVNAVTSSIDANITAGNIKKDIAILGVTGTYEGSGGGEFQLTRFKDDTDTEIGTHYCNFTDGNGNKFQVIILDAAYRNSSAQWASSTSAVTNMPLYNNQRTASAWRAKETATTNTQLILNFTTSTACTHCRNQSFVIGGTTYYGQLPNIIEVLELAKNYDTIKSMDTTSASNPNTNFSTDKIIWTSTQYAASSAWRLTTHGMFDFISKSNNYLVCPVLEIPLS